MKSKRSRLGRKGPGLPEDKEEYLHRVDEIYRNDAYHSLSIEGYSVTPEMIDRVRQGNWNPDNDEADRKSRRGDAAEQPHRIKYRPLTRG